MDALFGLTTVHPFSTITLQTCSARLANVTIDYRTRINKSRRRRGTQGLGYHSLCGSIHLSQAFRLQICTAASPKSNNSHPSFWSLCNDLEGRGALGNSRRSCGILELTDGTVKYTHHVSYRRCYDLNCSSSFCTLFHLRNHLVKRSVSSHSPYNQVDSLPTDKPPVLFPRQHPSHTRVPSSLSPSEPSSTLVEASLGLDGLQRG